MQAEEKRKIKEAKKELGRIQADKVKTKRELSLAKAAETFELRLHNVIHKFHYRHGCQPNHIYVGTAEYSALSRMVYLPPATLDMRDPFVFQGMSVHRVMEDQHLKVAG